MIEQFPVNANALRIPPDWKVHWDDLSAERIICPELRFESLLCLSLAPDFVLDFGWGLRDERVRYTLQINRGHFGQDDVVICEDWLAFEPALSMLQLWLDRLVADPATQAADTDLQARLAVIEARIRHFFIPPSGEEIEEPFARTLRRLILKEPAAYWLAGSGDAAIHYRNRYGVVQSQLIFAVRDPHGVHIEHHTPEGPLHYCVAPRPVHRDQTVVETTLGGAPWHIPATQFVSRPSAARIIADFIETGTGACPTKGKWVQ